MSTPTPTSPDDGPSVGSGASAPTGFPAAGGPDPGGFDVGVLQRLAEDFFGEVAIEHLSPSAPPVVPPVPGFVAPTLGPASSLPHVASPTPPHRVPTQPSAFTQPGFPSASVIPAIPTIPGVPEEPTTLGIDEPSASSGYYFIDERTAFHAAHAPVDVPSRPTVVNYSVLPDVPATPGVFDVHAVRAQFPILAERVGGRPLVWLDNAATTHKPVAVLDRIDHYYRHENSNVHRAAHTLAARSTDAYEAARSSAARFLGATSSSQIVFVRGATEAINLVANAWGRTHINAGDEILVSNLEHHANIVPWQMLAAERGAHLRVIPVNDQGELQLEALPGLLSNRTKIVAITQVSNALGTIVDVEPIIAAAHAVGARVLVDGAQSVSHLPVNVTALGADFFVFSGHKIFGPTGIGVLYGTSEALSSMGPWQGGGNMIADVTFERTVYQEAPALFEAGTGNIADAVGLGAALDYVESLGRPAIAAYEHDLGEYALDLLRSVPGVRLIGDAKKRASVLSFVVDGRDPTEIGKALDREGIAVRSGHHCAQPILRRMGVEATVRPSLALYNTCDEVDFFIDSLRRILGSKGHL